MKEIQTHHYLYINNVFGTFFRGLVDFFRTEWFPRVDKNQIIIATHERSVRAYLDRKSKGQENWSPRFPFISFSPEFDFEPDQQAGMFFHGYPNFQNAFAAKLWKPLLYQDDNITIAPALNRYKGTMEMILWCSSPYELMDYRFLTYQFFGGENRPIYPRDIEGFFILPDEFITYTYDNPYTGETYKLNWEDSSAEAVLIKSIAGGGEKWTFDFCTNPYIKLTGVSDGSDKYGGSGDEIGDHRLSVMMEWECQLPTHMILIADKMPRPCKDLVLEIQTNFNYVKVPINTTSPTTDNYIALNKNKTTFFSTDGTSTGEVDLVYKTTYLYTLTASDYEIINKENPADITENIIITLPEEVDDCIYLKVYGKFGEMTEGYHWKLSSPTTLELIGFNMNYLEEGNVISIVIYEVEEGL